MAKSNPPLGWPDELVLRAVAAEGDEGYGVTIQARINQATGRDVALGTIYTTLQRLVDAGYVSARIGQSSPERGGRAKKHFKVEAAGYAALQGAESERIRVTPTVAARAQPIER